MPCFVLKNVKKYQIVDNLVILIYNSIYYSINYIQLGITMRFGKQLKAIRLKLQLSQAAVAKQLGMPQSGIAKIESGCVDVRINTLDNLARTLGYEVVLIPKPFLSAVSALILGDEVQKPRWQISEEDEYE